MRGTAPEIADRILLVHGEAAGDATGDLCKQVQAVGAQAGPEVFGFDPGPPPEGRVDLGSVPSEAREVLVREWSWQVHDPWLGPLAKSLGVRWDARRELGRRFSFSKAARARQRRPGTRTLIRALEATVMGPWADLAGRIKVHVRDLARDPEGVDRAVRGLEADCWATQLAARFALLEHGLEGREALLRRREQYAHPTGDRAFYFGGLTPDAWAIWTVISGAGWAIAAWIGVSFLVPMIVGMVFYIALRGVPPGGQSDRHAYLAKEFERRLGSSRAVAREIDEAVRKELGPHIRSPEKALVLDGRAARVQAAIEAEQRQPYPEPTEWVCARCRVRIEIRDGLAACGNCGAVEGHVHVPGVLSAVLDGTSWARGDRIGEPEAVIVRGASDGDVESFVIRLGQRLSPERRRAIPCTVSGSELSENTMMLLRRTFDSVTVDAEAQGPGYLEQQLPVPPVLSEDMEPAALSAFEAPAERGSAGGDSRVRSARFHGQVVTELPGWFYDEFLKWMAVTNQRARAHLWGGEHELAEKLVDAVHNMPSVGGWWSWSWFLSRIDEYDVALAHAPTRIAERCPLAPTMRELVRRLDEFDRSTCSVDKAVPYRWGSP